MVHSLFFAARTADKLANAITIRELRCNCLFAFFPPRSLAASNLYSGVIAIFQTLGYSPPSLREKKVEPCRFMRELFAAFLISGMKDCASEVASGMASHLSWLFLGFVFVLGLKSRQRPIFRYGDNKPFSRAKINGDHLKFWFLAYKQGANRLHINLEDLRGSLWANFRNEARILYFFQRWAYLGRNKWTVWRISLLGCKGDIPWTRMIFHPHVFENVWQGVVSL